MTRLDTEYRRLYHPTPAGADESPGLIDARGHVRALVLELARPADWSTLSAVWQGVQAELGLPAPGIAVSGTDGLQLWFSLAQPVSLSSGHAFVHALQQRYLPDVAATRVRLMPAPDEASSLTLELPQVPALHPATGNWSAFIAPDLAPLFAETPWLDVPPGDDAQASLLAKLASIDAPSFEAAWAQLQPREPAAARQVVLAPSATTPDTHAADALALPTRGHDAAHGDADPVRFLLSVMNDASVPLPLRIEAAKALLPHWPAPRP